jgi:hypothetical protein
LYDNFLIQNSLKQGNALSPLLFNFALEYTIRKVQENQTRQNEIKWDTLAYADDVNLLGDNIDTIKRNMGTVTDASNEVGLEINIKNTEFILPSCHQNAGQNQYINVTNRSFKNVSHFKYLEMTVTDLKLIQNEIKRRMNSGFSAIIQSKTFFSS